MELPPLLKYVKEVSIIRGNRPLVFCYICIKWQPNAEVFIIPFMKPYGIVRIGGFYFDIDSTQGLREYTQIKYVKSRKEKLTSPVHNVYYNRLVALLTIEDFKEANRVVAAVQKLIQ